MTDKYLASGKLPEQLLASFLERVRGEGTSLLTPPSPGEDTGAVELENGSVLLYTTDPITFSSARIGYSSVVINANDIATSGGVPSWYLATLMAPPGISAEDVQTILQDIAATCRSLNIELAGGHTEITDAVTRPVISGTMLAVVERDRYIDKRNVQEGDVILITKSAGLEGTAILAEERREMLEQKGMLPSELDEARGFRTAISIAEEAAVAVASGGVSGMHDVTEGGVATALRELGAAAGREIHSTPERIPVHPATGRICSLLGIDPMGLLGSGSLLMCCRPRTAAGIIAGCRDKGIDAAEIGVIGKPGSAHLDLPRFAVDEITRVL
jgi:hydrogenase maturation factor